MKLNHYAQFAALRTADSLSNAGILDHFLEGSNGDEIREKVALKRLQFDTSTVLYSQVENVCSLLDCSKRVFLEMAVIDAIEKAETVFGETYQEATGHAFGEEDSFYSAQLNGPQIIDQG
jgi:ribosomal 30S subunit maturation factor RimM